MSIRKSNKASRAGQAGLFLAFPVLLGLCVLASPAFGQTELETGLGSTADGAPQASTCVRLSQDGAWVSDPTLAHPLMPFLRGEQVAWGIFAGAAVLYYLLAFAFFQAKVRSGGNPLNTFGRALVLWVLITGCTGYFLTGHLAYAETWCVDSTQSEIEGAAPARTDDAVRDIYGVGINEIVDRRAVPMAAHIRLTPWYFWLGGTLVFSVIFLFGFRSSVGSPVSEDSPTSGEEPRKSINTW